MAVDRPNILLILNDDMGYSDPGCCGGEIRTPNLDRLAANGLQYTQFYNTARCCPSRASLLTGLHPHQVGVGHMTSDDPFEGYKGDLNDRCVTIAEALGAAGYATFMSGKWHVTRHVDGPKHSWPCQRGFERFWGIITGAADYYHPHTLTADNERIEAEEGTYFTDAITDHMVQFIRDHDDAGEVRPFFGYLAYTAPHWPLHAPEEDIARYRGRFDRGWDVLRRERRERMVAHGLLDSDWPLTERDPRVPAWEDEPHKEWQARRMEVYAAQVDRMDQGIGRVLDALEATGRLDNTLIVFLADNGGCAEEVTEHWRPFLIGARIANEFAWDGTSVHIGNNPDLLPGDQYSYQSCGVPWANVQNTPFRLYKHWIHEGGIATPLIVHWPEGIAASGELRRQPAQLPDIMPTFLEAAGADYPLEYAGREVHPCAGYSLLPTFADDPSPRPALFWEHEGNSGIRRGDWKLVRRHGEPWELYNMAADRTEMHDLASREPARVQELARQYDEWAAESCVVPWDALTAERRRRRQDSD